MVSSTIGKESGSPNGDVVADVGSQMALELFQRAYQLQMQGEWDLSVDLDRAAEAIPSLEQATSSRRYDSFHYPWYKLAVEALACLKPMIQ